MTASSAILMICMAVALGGAILTYERLLAATRRERDEAIADCELFSELLIDQARERHPSAQYGGGNLRVVR